MHKPLGIKEAAALIGVSRVTLRKWDKEGLLKASYTNGGHRRYRLVDLLEFCGDSSNEEILGEVSGGSSAERVLEDVNNVLISELEERIRQLEELNGSLKLENDSLKEANRVASERLKKASEVYQKQKEQIDLLMLQIKKAQAV